MRNVEIKAKVRDPADLLSRVTELSDTECVLLKQCDTFFCVSKGRLKLREFGNDTSELIYYVRPNTAGPKVCIYQVTLLKGDTTQQLKDTLTQSNGVIGTVQKTRQLYLVGQTRIHIDEVDGLGHFMELETILKDDQDTELGEKIVQDLMLALNINKDDLVSKAYIDMLTNSD